MPGSCEGGGLCRGFVSCSARGELPFLCRNSCRFQKRFAKKRYSISCPGPAKAGGSAAISFPALLVRVSLLQVSPGPALRSAPEKLSLLKKGLPKNVTVSPARVLRRRGFCAVSCSARAVVPAPGKDDGQGVIFWCGFLQKGDLAGLFLKRGGFVAFFCNREPHLEGLVRGVSSLPAGGRRGKPLPDLRSRARFCGGLSMDCMPCGYTIYIRGPKMLLKRLKQRGFYDKIEA